MSGAIDNTQIENPSAPAPGPSPAPAPASDRNTGAVENGHQNEVLDEQHTDPENPGEERPKKPIQPRINELVRKAHEAQREAAYWRGVAEASKKPEVASPAPAAAPKPTPDQFQDYNEYVEALTDWKSDRAVEKALATVNSKIEERSQQQTAAQQEKERVSNWNTRQEEIRKVLPDYDEVMLAGQDIPISQAVGELLHDSEFGPAIAYKLAKDPELAAKLSGMSERQAAKEFGKLEASFAAAPAPSSDNSNAPAPPAPAVPANASKAPPPPKPIQQGRSTSKDISKMSMDEYIAHRKSLGLGR